MSAALALTALWLVLVVLPLVPSLVSHHKGVFWNLSGCTTSVNLYLHQAMPNLFQLPTSVQAEGVQARVPFVAPVDAARTRIAPAARVRHSSQRSMSG